MFKAASGLMRSLAGELGKAQQENEKLEAELAQAKAAAANKVELAKVASVSISDEYLNEFLRTLADHSMLADSQLAKAAAALKDNPNEIIKLATQAIRLSEIPSPQGEGYQSTSASSEEDLEAYYRERERAIVSRWL